MLRLFYSLEVKDVYIKVFCSVFNDEYLVPGIAQIKLVMSLVDF